MKMIMVYVAALLMAVLGLHSCADTARAQETVSVAIVLAADVSSSIDADRFKLQREGYAYALTHPEVIRAVMERGRVALTYVEWASTQRVVVPWTIIRGPEELVEFAQRLYDAPRSFDGNTAIGDAVAFSLLLLETAPPAQFRVIDVSGDGDNNLGRSPEGPRDTAAAMGVTINGIVLPTADVTMVERHYRNAVIGGPNAFCVVVSNWEDFAFALIGKLVREIS